MELGKLDFKAAKKEVAQLGEAGEAVRKQLGASLVDLEIVYFMLDGARFDGGVLPGKRFLEFEKAGNAPPDSSKDLALFFWGQILQHAGKEEAVELFADSLSHVKKLVGHEERYKPWFEEQNKRLEELKKKAAGRGKG